jgi:hypothetical protein
MRLATVASLLAVSRVTCSRYRETGKLNGVFNEFPKNSARKCARLPANSRIPWIQWQALFGIYSEGIPLAGFKTP